MSKMQCSLWSVLHLNKGNRTRNIRYFSRKRRIFRVSDKNSSVLKKMGKIAENTRCNTNRTNFCEHNSVLSNLINEINQHRKINLSRYIINRHCTETKFNQILLSRKIKSLLHRKKSSRHFLESNQNLSIFEYNLAFLSGSVRKKKFFLKKIFDKRFQPKIKITGKNNHNVELQNFHRYISTLIICPDLRRNMKINRVMFRKILKNKHPKLFPIDLLIPYFTVDDDLKQRGKTFMLQNITLMTQFSSNHGFFTKLFSQLKPDTLFTNKLLIAYLVNLQRFSKLSSHQKAFLMILMQEIDPKTYSHEVTQQFLSFFTNYFIQMLSFAKFPYMYMDFLSKFDSIVHDKFIFVTCKSCLGGIEYDLSGKAKNSIFFFLRLFVAPKPLPKHLKAKYENIVQEFAINYENLRHYRKRNSYNFFLQTIILGKGMQTYPSVTGMLGLIVNQKDFIISFLADEPKRATIFLNFFLNPVKKESHYLDEPHIDYVVKFFKTMIYFIEATHYDAIKNESLEQAVLWLMKKQLSDLVAYEVLFGSSARNNTSYQQKQIYFLSNIKSYFDMIDYKDNETLEKMNSLVTDKIDEVVALRNKS